MDAGTVAAFLAVDLLLVFTPGADWAYAITAGLRHRSVVPAVAGLVAGYTVLAVAGLVVIVASSAILLTALTVLGAAYLMWLGRGVLARPATPRASTEVMAGSHRQVMLKGAGISGLNPKALLLYFSLFPQFIDPRRTGPWPLRPLCWARSTWSAAPSSASPWACWPGPCCRPGRQPREPSPVQAVP